MPLLDVSDILGDADFADELICFRNPQTMGSDGRAVNGAVTIPFSGVVWPDSGQGLVRRPEGEYNRGAIKIATQFMLYTGTAGYSADVLQWNGNTYTVQRVDDYSRYGAGYTLATAELRELSG